MKNLSKNTVANLVETTKLGFGKFKHFINASSLLEENAISQNIYLSFVAYQDLDTLDIEINIGYNDGKKEDRAYFEDSESNKQQFISFVKEYIQEKRYL